MDSLSQFLDTKWYVLGNAVRQFESAYAQFIGQQHSVGVSSGMAALHLALRAAGIGPGDEVIVPANTYIATWLAVSYVGAKLVPVDPDPVTGNFSAELVARVRTVLTLVDRGMAVLDLDESFDADEHHRLARAAAAGRRPR